jgi:thiamine-monophosphate kinase
MARPSPLHEFRLIKQVQHAFARTSRAVVCGIGDDAAVLTPSKGRQLVLTTDLVVEGVHFEFRTSSFEDIGYKAAIANLSDIAAMGARPDYVLVSLAFPASWTMARVRCLYKGIMAACHTHRVALIGGDTSSSPDRVFLNLTVLGSIPPGAALFRSGARVGDLVYVSGTLGDSLAGLVLLTAGQRRRDSRRLTASHRRFLVGRHLRPTARLRLGAILSAQRLATAAIDLSDGLSGDLRHLCEQSCVGAELDVSALPLSSALRAYSQAFHCDPASLALQGGEDYELLFTVPTAKQQALDRATRRIGHRVTCIGVIRPQAFGVRIRDEHGRLRQLPLTSYVHFRSRDLECSLR